MSDTILDECGLDAAAKWLAEARASGKKPLIEFGAAQIIEAYLQAAKQVVITDKDYDGWKQEYAEATREVNWLRDNRACGEKAMTIPSSMDDSPWQSIETCPHDECGAYLFLLPGNDVCKYLIVQGSWYEGWAYPDHMDGLIDYADRILNATHWMALPPLPKIVKIDKIRAIMRECPFCGGEGKISDATGKAYPPFQPHCSKCRFSYGAFTTKEKAMTGWNTRHESKQQEVLRQVRDALDYAGYCITAHSARLGEALDEMGESEPQFACEATYTCDKIEAALASLSQLISQDEGRE